jgi:sporulation protein YlmC with PRC-barrel domain
MRLTTITLAGAMVLVASAPLGQAFSQTAVLATTAPKFVTQQPANEWLARVFLGEGVQNTAGETVGDINDLAFDRQGQIRTVVIGVGGFLSMGEKSVGVPFDALTFNVGASGERVIVVALSKDDLAKAPEFKAIEKTTFDKVKDRASELSNKAADKAVELKDQAVQKIDDMKKSEPVKQ